MSKKGNIFSLFRGVPLGRWEEGGFPTAAQGGGGEGKGGGVGFLALGVFRRAKMEAFLTRGFQWGWVGFQRGVGTGGF